MKTTTYICQLSNGYQFIIRNKIERFLRYCGLTGEILADSIQNVMNGRICDLENDINVTKLFYHGRKE